MIAFYLSLSLAAGPLQLPEPGPGVSAEVLQDATGRYRAAVKQRDRVQTARLFSSLVRSSAEDNRAQMVFMYGRALASLDLDYAALYHLLAVIEATPERDLNNGAAVLAASQIAVELGALDAVASFSADHPAARAPGSDSWGLRTVLVYRALVAGDDAAVFSLFEPVSKLDQWTSLELGVVVGRLHEAAGHLRDAAEVYKGVAKASTGGVHNARITDAKAEANVRIGRIHAGLGHGPDAIKRLTQAQEGRWGAIGQAEAAVQHTKAGDAKAATRALKAAEKLRGDHFVPEVALAAACGGAGMEVLRPLQAQLDQVYADLERQDWSIVGEVAGLPRASLLEVLPNPALGMPLRGPGQLARERARLDALNDEVLSKALASFYGAEEVALAEAAAAAVAPTTAAIKGQVARYQARVQALLSDGCP